MFLYNLLSRHIHFHWLDLWLSFPGSYYKYLFNWCSILNSNN